MVVLKSVLINLKEKEKVFVETVSNDNPYVKIIGSFGMLEEAVKYVESYEVDMIVVNIDGFEVEYVKIKDIFRRLNRKMILVFMTDRRAEVLKDNAGESADFVLDKFKSDDDFHSFIMDASILFKERAKTVLDVQTFGHFDVYSAKGPIRFVNAKAKELFALCIDHLGAPVTMEEAVDKLWPERLYDDKAKRLYRKAVFCLRDALKAVGCGSVFSTFRGGCFVRVENLNCEFFDFLKKMKEGQVSRELLETYMPEYPWAEYTIAKLYFSIDIGE